MLDKGDKIVLASMNTQLEAYSNVLEDMIQNYQAMYDDLDETKQDSATGEAVSQLVSDLEQARDELDSVFSTIGALVK
jgi:hypothetical protein